MRRTCPNGHEFRKSSDCPTCPKCESERKPASGLLSALVAPARRALAREGIDTVATLSKRTRKEILALHGVGPSTIPTLERLLGEAGLDFRAK
jgi:hypothetical protein